MKKAELGEPDAVIWINRMGFQVWISNAGVRRIILPAFDVLAPFSREEGQAIKTVARDGAATGNREILSRLGTYLGNMLSGTSAQEPLSMDLRCLNRFTRQVLRTVAEIPWGQTRSYGWIADQIRHPGAARAVGNAVAKNPLPLLIPCHRVVRSDGSVGGWSGPPGWKEYLLELEASDSR
jgi:methylated-DNA-[protein]-cysteine S-methyltransferase